MIGSPQHQALYDSCLTTVMSAGSIPKAQAKQLLREAQIYIRNQQSVSGISAQQALTQASAQITVRLKAQAAGIRRAALDSAMKLTTNQTVAEQLVRAGGTYGEALSVRALGDRASKVAGGAIGADQYQKAFSHAWRGELIQSLDAAGVRHDFIRGRYAKDVNTEMWNIHSNLKAGVMQSVTGNKEAYAIAKAVYGSYERVRAAYNLEGGMMGKDDFFTQTQTHDPDLIRRRGGSGPDSKVKSKVQWTGMMLRSLDLQRTFPDLDLGDTRAITHALDLIHDNIISGTHIQSKSSSPLLATPHHGAMASRLESERVLHFKGPDEFFAYNQLFGSQSYNDAAIANIHKMSKAVGLMKVFGRNPEAGWQAFQRWAKGQSNKMQVNDKRQSDSLKTNWHDKTWAVLSGEVDNPKNPKWYKVQRVLSNWMIASKLGKLVLSAVPDHATMHLQGQRIGAKRWDSFTHQLMSLAPKDADFNKIAGEMSAGVDAILGVMADSLEPDLRGNDWSGAMVRQMFQLTGANWWTKVHDQAFGVLFSKVLGDAAGSSIAGMSNKSLAKNMERYGISELEWDFMRKQIQDIKGNKYLTVDAVQNAPDSAWSAAFGGVKGTELARTKQDVVSRFQAMISDEIDTATLKPGARERVVTTGGLSTGTAEGWAWRSVWMLKSYPLAMLNKVVRPMFRDIRMQKSVGDKLFGSSTRNMIEFVAYSTFLGMISNTLSDLHAGKTPQEPFDEKGNLRWNVVQRGMLRGGGVSFFGDLLLTEYDKTYKNFGQALLGPQIGVASDLMALKTAAAKAAAGERSSVKGDALKLVVNNAPVANWLVIRPGLEYLFLNSLIDKLSPGAMDRIQERARKNHQGIWMQHQEPFQ